MSILEKLSQDEISALLRKPEGELGIEMAEMMAEHNAFMSHLTYDSIQLETLDHVLEMGIGNGTFLKKLKGIIGEGKLVGIDYSPTMVEKAIENNQDLVQQKQVEIVHASIENMPFKDETFSKIVTVNTLYFWDNTDAYLSEIKRVLKTGGKLAIGFRPKHIIEKLPFVRQGFAFYTMQEVQDLLEQHSFVIHKQLNEVDNRFADLEASVIVAEKQ